MNKNKYGNITNADYNNKIFCPIHGQELLFDVFGAISSVHSNIYYNGLHCPVKDCKYKI